MSLIQHPASPTHQKGELLLSAIGPGVGYKHWEEAGLLTELADFDPEFGWLQEAILEDTFPTQ